MSKASVEYVGFRNTAQRREYHLRSRSGAETQEYTVAIALEAFTSGAARLQDGPEICYLKLQRELEATTEPGTHEFDVTTNELAAYREMHAPAKKRWNSPGSGAGATPAATPPVGAPKHEEGQ